MPSLSSLESAFVHRGVHPFLFMLLLRFPSLLPTLTLSPLMIWYSGLMALFLFLLAKAAQAFLSAALTVAPRPLFSFQQAQYLQVFPLKPASFCTLFASLGSTNKSATSLLLPDSRSVLSLHLFFYLKLSSLFYQATMGPRTLVSPGERRG